MNKFNELLKEAIVVDFTASCQMIKPNFEQLSTEVTDLVFAGVDIDEANEVGQHYLIEEMPTLLFCKGENEVYIICGDDFDCIKAKVYELK